MSRAPWGSSSGDMGRQIRTFGPLASRTVRTDTPTDPAQSGPMPARRGSPTPPRPLRRRAALLLGGLGLAVLLAVGTGLRDSPGPGSPLLPTTAAPPPQAPGSLDDADAPEGGGLAPLAPDQLDPGAG